MNHPLVQCLGAIYLIMQGSILVAGIVTQIEIQHKLWGVMSTIPLTILFAMTRDVVMETKNNTSLLNFPGKVFQTIVLHRITPMILTLLSAILIISSPQIMYTHPAEPDSSPPPPILYILVIPFVVMLSTPVFGGGEPDLGHNGILTSAASGVWYILILMLVDKIPSLTSWFGIPLVVVCCTQIIGSFHYWSGDLQIAWSLASVLTGLLISGSSGWWSRLIIICVLGIMRIVLLVVQVYYDNLLQYHHSGSHAEEEPTTLVRGMTMKLNGHNDIMTPLLFTVPYNNTLSSHATATMTSHGGGGGSKNQQDLKCMFRLSGRV